MKNLTIGLNCKMTLKIRIILKSGKMKDFTSLYTAQNFMISEEVESIELYDHRLNIINLPPSLLREMDY